VTAEKNSDVQTMLQIVLERFYYLPIHGYYAQNTVVTTSDTYMVTALTTSFHRVWHNGASTRCINDDSTPVAACMHGLELVR
jgi:Partial alpha/beta-hydrolase lipase region